MKYCVALLLFLTAAVFEMKAEVDPKFQIYLCFGQSNMEGGSPAEPVDMEYVDERFITFAARNFESPARSLGNQYTAYPPIVSDKMVIGMADYFGRSMVAALPADYRVGVVDVAVGGARIQAFISELAKDYMEPGRAYIEKYGGNLYERIVYIAKIAQQYGVIKGILLHQGETDAYNDQWRKTLRKIYRDLQQELRFDSTAVPLLVGEVVRGEYGGICGHANPTINDIANHYPNTYVVSSEGCLPSDDNLHFSSEGYRQLGRHYALRYLEATNPQLAEVCRQKLAAAGLDKGGTVSSKLTVETKRSGETLSVVASEPVEKVDVVSFSGQTVKTFTLNGKKNFELSLKDLPKEKLVFVFQSAEGKATTDVDI